MWGGSATGLGSGHICKHCSCGVGAGQGPNLSELVTPITTNQPLSESTVQLIVSPVPARLFSHVHVFDSSSE